MVSQIYLKWKLSLPFSNGFCSILRLSVSQANPILSPVPNGGLVTSFRLVSCWDIPLSTKHVLKAPFPLQASMQEMGSKELTNAWRYRMGYREQAAGVQWVQLRGHREVQGTGTFEQGCEEWGSSRWGEIPKERQVFLCTASSQIMTQRLLANYERSAFSLGLFQLALIT